MSGSQYIGKRVAMHHEKTKMQLPHIPVNGRIITDYLTSNRFAGQPSGRKNEKSLREFYFVAFLKNRKTQLNGQGFFFIFI